MAVAVTGLGAVCAAGLSVPRLWQAVIDGHSGLTWCPHVRAALARIHEPLAAEIDGIALHRADRAVRLASMAASQILDPLRRAPAAPERVGVVLGTSRGPIDTWARSSRLAASGERQPPTFLVQGTLASLSGTVSLLAQAQGPSFTVSSTCASAAHAIAIAADLIESGAIDLAITGGADAPLDPVILEQFRAVGLLGTHDDLALACRPFDRSRNGTVLGEGAGVLLLESLSSARRRGMQPLALVQGWAMTCDAAGRASIEEDGRGLRRAIELALARAGAGPSEIGYINAHGTGTKQNDLRESASIAAVLGAGRPCSSVKPIIGHCAGAAPALEAIVTIRALQEGLLPATASCRAPDPECPIDPIPGQPRPAPVRMALSTSLGLWGNNAALVFSRGDSI